MFSRITGYASVTAALFAVLGCGEIPKGDPNNPQTQDKPPAANPHRGNDLLARGAPVIPDPGAAPSFVRGTVDPIVIDGCRLTVFEKEEVPSQRDGVLLFIGTEIKNEEWDKLPENLKIK